MLQSLKVSKCRVARLLALAGCGAVACVPVLASSAAPAPQFAYRGISVGQHSTCAITIGGAARCWGNTVSGELGNRAPMRAGETRVPVTVLGLGSGVTALTGGAQFNCAIVRGAARCWGTGRTHGELGSGRKESSVRPVAVAGLDSGVKAIDAGLLHACAITSAGGVRCWGFGVLGNGQRTGTLESATPVDVVGLTSGTVAITAGHSISCAITSGGTVKCWGGGTLGNGTNKSNGGLLPVNVTGVGSGVRAISAGADHVCAITSAGGLKCWGDNGNRQVGNGTNLFAAIAPVDVIGLTSGVAAVATGDNHTCALTSAGAVKCWGLNNYGQLGNGRQTASLNTPQDVVGLDSGVRAVAAGGDTTCAIDRAGITKCWGNNNSSKAGLALPFRVHYSTVPRAVYGQGVTPTVRRLTSFRSPTGNLSCRLSATIVRCQSRQRPHSATLSENGAVTICRGTRCLSATAAGTPTVGYGGLVHLGPFVCASEFSGIRCTTSAGGGRGFVINKDGAHAIG